jgi:hypothetical protein
MEVPDASWGLVCEVDSVCHVRSLNAGRLPDYELVISRIMRYELTL